MSVGPFFGGSPGFFLGVRVVQNQYAVQRNREVSVTRNPIKKRRRGYRVVIREWTTPSAYQLADGTMVVHPEIYARLTKA